MTPKRLQWSFFGLLSVFATCLFSLNAEQLDEVQEAANWPWEKPYKFKCPSSFGAFSDPDDCASYFVCVANIPTHKTCKRMTLFDKNIRRCVSFIIAVCDNSGKDKTSTKAPKTEGTTPEGGNFICPNLIGTFEHPTDCSKYYSCTVFIPSLKACPDNELFDGVKKKCKPANEVHCGTRIKPTEPTPEITTLVTTPEETRSPTELPSPTTSEPPVPTTTETPIPTTTEPPVTTTTEPPVSTTTEPPVSTTTKKPRVTAPDTTCTEDDLDCIIDDLGENPVWFVCDEDVGSYPHPTSNKLFIFCLNWKPSVKKCGQDLVFSEDLLTCVSP